MRHRKRKRSGSRPSADTAVLVAQILFVVLGVALAGGLVWLFSTYRF